MVRFILKAMVSALGLYLASVIVPGIHVSSFGVLIAAAVLLGVVNAIVRPVLVILTLPFTLITMGLFLLVVNAAMLGLVSLILKGFVIDGFWAAILAAIVTGLVSWVATSVIDGPDAKSTGGARFKVRIERRPRD
ncbi:MAG: phage holin family protein [Proteobacteria bacterium]|nr:phage holin family protein [Pseudomonadota bacterium]